MRYYEDYIRYAQDNGYEIISLEQFYQLPNRRNGKHFILRHDIDWQGISTRKLYLAEKEMQVTSTMYFRFSTIDNNLIRELITNRFNVGFHFETIADYAMENSIDDKSKINLGVVRERFIRETQRFEEITGCKVRSVCSHGHPVNKQLGISNNAITENFDLTKWGILFEAYEQKMYRDDIDCHILDGGILKNYGFQYKDNPYDAIDKGYQNIVFVSHPHNWYMSFKKRMILALAWIRGKAEYSTNREFIRIAK